VPTGRTSPRDLPLFANLTGGQIKEILTAGEEVTVPPGWSFIGERTPPDAAYLILAGSAVVRDRGEQLAELGPGEIVGEVGIRQNRLRTATVTANTRLRLLHFSKDDFVRLTDSIPGFRKAIDETIAKRRGGSQG
jgi:CRP/FNR family transcriptional regulator, cyclic AMP receptor protein